MCSTDINGGVRRGVLRTALALVTLFATSGLASAQAWVAPGHVGSVSIVFQDVQHTGHLLHDGSELGGYDSESQGLLLEIDYAFTDRFSITAGIPYIGSRYIGPEPSFFGLEIDDCHCWNRGWQDFSLTARYNVKNDGFAFTPSISIGLPSNSYPFVGEAVVGRQLNELRLAMDLGKRIDTVSDRWMVFGRYSYAFVEEVLGIDTDRSNLSIGTGYAFTRRFSGSLELYWQWTHGGLNSTEFVTDELFLQFDRLLKDNSFHIGGTIAYSFPRLEVFASYIEFVDGKDTHVGHAITLGVGWPFEI